jgi:hypothetical protein
MLIAAVFIITAVAFANCNENAVNKTAAKILIFIKLGLNFVSID